MEHGRTVDAFHSPLRFSEDFFFIWVKECFLFFPRPEMGKKRIFNKNLWPLLLSVSLPHQEQPRAFMKAGTRRKVKKSTKRREKKKERKGKLPALCLSWIYYVSLESYGKKKGLKGRQVHFRRSVNSWTECRESRAWDEEPSPFFSSTVYL